MANVYVGLGWVGCVASTVGRQKKFILTNSNISKVLMCVCVLLGNASAVPSGECITYIVCSVCHRVRCGNEQNPLSKHLFNILLKCVCSRSVCYM